MASLVLTGDTSGQVTIAAPAVAGTTTLTLPATTGTVLNDATVGVCRAWVNFNGTSITDNGTGDYTVNFTTAMPDANYGVSGLVGPGSSSNRVATGWFDTPTTTTYRIRCNSAAFAATDTEYVSISVFR
jgi:hypothetical protein